MRDKILAEVYAEAREMLQEKYDANPASAPRTWLMAAMSQLDSSETYCEAAEDAVVSYEDAKKQAQRMAQIQAASQGEVARHNADLAARAERQRESQEPANPPTGD